MQCEKHKEDGSRCGAHVWQAKSIVPCIPNQAGPRCSVAGAAGGEPSTNSTI